MGKRFLHSWNGEKLVMKEKELNLLIKNGYAEYNNKLGKVMGSDKGGVIEFMRKNSIRIVLRG